MRKMILNNHVCQITLLSIFDDIIVIKVVDSTILKVIY